MRTRWLLLAELRLCCCPTRWHVARTGCMRRRPFGWHRRGEAQVTERTTKRPCHTACECGGPPAVYKDHITLSDYEIHDDEWGRAHRAGMSMSWLASRPARAATGAPAAAATWLPTQLTVLSSPCPCLHAWGWNSTTSKIGGRCTVLTWTGAAGAEAHARPHRPRLAAPLALLASPLASIPLLFIC